MGKQRRRTVFSCNFCQLTNAKDSMWGLSEGMPANQNSTELEVLLTIPACGEYIILTSLFRFSLHSSLFHLTQTSIWQVRDQSQDISASFFLLSNQHHLALFELQLWLWPVNFPSHETIAQQGFRNKDHSICSPSPTLLS